MQYRYVLWKQQYNIIAEFIFGGQRLTAYATTYNLRIVFISQGALEIEGELHCFVGTLTYK